MDNNIVLFIIVGFFAQIVDGAIGMAYGVTSTSFLLGMGVPAALASATVHTAEVFTTFVSGVSHFKFGNVDKDLFKKLLIPGVIGGIAGAYILTSISSEYIKPAVSVYLAVMGIRIICKALKKTDEVKPHGSRFIETLALIGGFCDAIGGGGWGPIVTTSLVEKGKTPRFVIGSVNAAEFFVTLVQSITFIFFIKTMYWAEIIGLIIGGVVAAPCAAFLCRKIPARQLIVFVGSLIIFLSLRTILGVVKL